MLSLAVGVLALGLCVQGFAQSQGDAVIYSPEKLPGKGLAQHDFMYAGESHQRRIFVVCGRERLCGAMTIQQARARLAMR
jgi:hypothetical protein